MQKSSNKRELEGAQKKDIWLCESSSDMISGKCSVGFKRPLAAGYENSVLKQRGQQNKQRHGNMEPHDMCWEKTKSLWVRQGVVRTGVILYNCAGCTVHKDA